MYDAKLNNALDNLKSTADILRRDADTAARAARVALDSGNRSEHTFHTGRQAAFLSAANLARAAYNDSVFSLAKS